MKYLILVLFFIIISSSATPVSEDKKKCVRWKWTGDVFERKVYCVEWKKKDCSNRLYEEMCKRE